LELPLRWLVQSSLLARLKPIMAALVAAAAGGSPADAAAAATTDGRSLHEVFAEVCTATSCISQAYMVALVGRTVFPPSKRIAFDTLVGRLGDTICLVLVGGGGIGAEGRSKGGGRADCDVGLSVTVLVGDDGGICTAVVQSLLAAGLKPTDLLPTAPQPQLDAGTFIAPRAFRGGAAGATLSLALLRARFPITTSPAVLTLRCAAMLLQQWEQDCRSMEVLVAALDYIDVGGHVGLRTTVLHNVWLQLLKKPFTELVSLVKKTHKSPKDRLCREKLQLDKESASRFAHTTHRAVATLLTAVSTDREGGDEGANGNEGNLGWGAGTDHRWTEGHVDTEMEQRLLGGGSIMDAATSVLALNLVVVTQHANLARVIALVMLLDLKSAKPYELFPEVSQGMLFAPFESDHPDDEIALAAAEAAGRASPGMVYDDPTEAAAAATAGELQSSRRQFLSRALCAAVHASTQPVSGLEAAADEDVDAAPALLLTLQPFRSLLPSTADVLGLAQTMGLGTDDTLLRQYVCNLFEIGQDTAAEGVLLQVSNTEAMAAALLEIVGLRLSILVDKSKSDNALELVQLIPAEVYEWARAVQQATPLSGRGGCTKMPLESITALVALMQSLHPTERSATALRLNQLVAAMAAL
jgi:hypothetical protein